MTSWLFNIVELDRAVAENICIIKRSNALILLNNYTTSCPHVDLRAVVFLDLRLRFFAKRSFLVTHTLRLRTNVRLFVKRHPVAYVCSFPQYAVMHLDLRLRFFEKRSFQVTHTLRLRPHVRVLVKRYPVAYIVKALQK